MGSEYKRQLNEWKSTLDVKAKKVFDIGGAQDPITRHVRSWDVEDYKIIDLEVPHVEEVKPDIAHDMNYFWDKDETADLIFCLGVSDYIINPNIFMLNIHNMLTEDGTAWVEFPFVYPVHQPTEEEGCRYSEGSIRRLAKQAKLNIEEIIYKRPKADNPFLEMFYRADGMRAAKGVDHNVTGYIVRVSK